MHSEPTTRAEDLAKPRGARAGPRFSFLRTILATSYLVDFQIHGLSFTRPTHREQIIVVLGTLFVFASSGYMRNILVAFSCTPKDKHGRSFLKAELETMCDDSPKYRYIQLLGCLGLLVYVALFGIELGSDLGKKRFATIMHELPK